MEAIDNTLKAQYEALKKEEPRLRAKQAAEKLGVTEAEVTQVFPNAIPLKQNFKTS